jgi:hypothetical protein
MEAFKTRDRRLLRRESSLEVDKLRDFLPHALLQILALAVVRGVLRAVGRKDKRTETTPATGDLVRVAFPRTTPLGGALFNPQSPGAFAKVRALLRAGASLDNVSDDASAEAVLQQWEAEVVAMHGRPLNDESRFHIAANVATVNALVADVRRAGGSWKQWTLLSPTAYFFSEARLTDSHTGRPRRCSDSGRRSRAVR